MSAIWKFDFKKKKKRTITFYIKGPYADHILTPPPGSTGSSVFFGFKWKPIFF